MANDNKGWHGDSEGHREAAKERTETKTKTNWWPLLFLPIAFVAGWGMGEAGNNQEQAYDRGAQTQPGVGGGPEVSPSISPDMDTAR